MRGFLSVRFSRGSCSIPAQSNRPETSTESVLGGIVLGVSRRIDSASVARMETLIFPVPNRGYPEHRNPLFRKSEIQCCQNRQRSIPARSVWGIPARPLPHRTTCFHFENVAAESVDSRPSESVPLPESKTCFHLGNTPEHRLKFPSLLPKQAKTLKKPLFANFWRPISALCCLFRKRTTLTKPLQTGTF